MNIREHYGITFDFCGAVGAVLGFVFVVAIVFRLGEQAACWIIGCAP